MAFDIYRQKLFKLVNLIIVLNTSQKTSFRAVIFIQYRFVVKKLTHTFNTYFFVFKVSSDKVDKLMF